MGHKHSDEFRNEAVRIALTSGLARRQTLLCIATVGSAHDLWPPAPSIKKAGRD